MIYRFAGFELDPTARSLRSTDDGRAIALTAKAFDTLLQLVEHGGRLVEKQTLIDAVWPNVVVEEGNLKQTISVLRRALGDDRQTPKYIATISGRGYQFIAAVEIRREGVEQANAQGAPDRSGPNAPVPRRRPIASFLDRRLGVGIFAVSVFAVAAWALQGHLWPVETPGTRIALQTAEPDQPPRVPGFSDRPAIAVLPFEPFGNDPVFSHPTVPVAGRTSACQATKRSTRSCTRRSSAA